jgi:UDP-2,3-diacylglucosamine hydrolase
MKAAEITDVTPTEVERVMSEHGVRTLIHGHTHRPCIHAMTVNGQAAQRIVLGDWDRQGWALQIDDHGLVQTPFPLEA